MLAEINSVFSGQNLLILKSWKDIGLSTFLALQSLFKNLSLFRAINESMQKLLQICLRLQALGRKLVGDILLKISAENCPDRLTARRATVAGLYRFRKTLLAVSFFCFLY